METEARCPTGVARIETRRSLVNYLVNFLTLGIYTPMQIDVTCAAPIEGVDGIPRRPAPPDTIAAVRAAETDQTIPPGTRWVGDGQRRFYLPVGCRAVADIPRPDRFYFRTEAAARADGYSRSEQC